MMRGLFANMNTTDRPSTRCAVQKRSWWFGRALGEVGVRRSLLELGLDVRKLPTMSRARFRHDVDWLAGESCEPHSRRRVAMRFFTWYVMEAPDFTPAALKSEGAVSDAIGVILAWCETNPELVRAAAPEFHRLSAHLFDKQEGPVARRYDVRRTTQMRLVDS